MDGTQLVKTEPDSESYKMGRVLLVKLNPFSKKLTPYDAQTGYKLYGFKMLDDDNMYKEVLDVKSISLFGIKGYIYKLEEV